VSPDSSFQSWPRILARTSPSQALMLQTQSTMASRQRGVAVALHDISTPWADCVFHIGLALGFCSIYAGRAVARQNLYTVLRQNLYTVLRHWCRSTMLPLDSALNTIQKC